MKREREEYIASVKAQKKHTAYMERCGKEAEDARIARIDAEKNAADAEKTIRDLYDGYVQRKNTNYQNALEASQKLHYDK